MDNKPQTWFEMPEIKKRFYDKSVWIPLKESRALFLEGDHGQVGFTEEYFGVGTIAVPLLQRNLAEKLEWIDVGIRGSSPGYVRDGEYVPSHVYINDEGTLIAEHLIVSGRGNSEECSEWHLSPDLVVTLNLKREGDFWLAIDRGYEQVAKMERNENGCANSLSIKANYLKDYLCARKMGLYITSYRSRTQIIDDRSKISWPDPHLVETDTDKWEGRVTEIHEGGQPFGSGFSVLHVSRTDVDPDEDVPEPGFPGDDVTKSQSWEGDFEGRKLYRIEGELWRSEWVEPAEHSYIVCEEKAEPTSFFITDNEGKIENRITLVNGIRWLWFKPSVINAILEIRGSFLGWYTRDTGQVGCAPGHGVHFGINRIGLINVLSKDVALLPDWQQQIWAAHNTAPDGKVSSELLMSQMEAKPASTQAPEEYLPEGIKLLNSFAVKRYGISIITEHSDADQILARTHRFRAISKGGLYELAKDLHRLVGERIDSDRIKKNIKSQKDEVLGSLKALERLLALQVGDDTAYKVLGVLHGIYTLRNADSHLPPADLKEAYVLCRIDSGQPLVIQGYQMIHACVSCLFTICKVLE